VFIDEQDDADLEDDTLPNTDEVPDEDADTDD
jgi:hypothetical protein